MKRQQRPFTVEFKGPRKRPRSIGLSSPAGSHHAWIDPFSDDVPERDVHEGFVSEERADVFHEAEKVFSTRRQPASVPVTAGPDQEADPVLSLQITAAGAQLPQRILPDLLTRSGEEKQPVIDQPVRLRASRRSALRAQPHQDEQRPQQADFADLLESPSPPQVHDTTPAHFAEPTASVSLAVGVRSRTKVRRGHKLPSGEGWKRRRLPRICWDR